MSPPWFTSATSRSARVRVVERHRPLGPGLRRGAAQAAVRDHLGRPVLRRRRSSRRPATTMPHSSEFAPLGHRRVDRHHDPVELERRAAPAPPRASPRSRARPRRRATSSPSSSCRPSRWPPYFARHRLEEARRQVHPVRRRSAPASPPCPASSRIACSSGVRPRRRRHHRPRPLAEPQRELQHVPGRLALLPLGELVAPGAVELRPAQRLRVARREDLRHRPVRPDQPLAAWPATPAGGRAASQAMMPDGPNTITSRASSSVSPTRATRELVPGSPGLPPSTCARTHSAPARVLPAPRPPRMTQVVQSPSGGS